MRLPLLRSRLCGHSDATRLDCHAVAVYFSNDKCGSVGSRNVCATIPLAPARAVLTDSRNGYIHLVPVRVALGFVRCDGDLRFTGCRAGSRSNRQSIGSHGLIIECRCLVIQDEGVIADPAFQQISRNTRRIVVTI